MLFSSLLHLKGVLSISSHLITAILWKEEEEEWSPLYDDAGGLRNEKLLLEWNKMASIIPATVSTPPTIANNEVRKVEKGTRFSLTLTMNGVTS